MKYLPWFIMTWIGFLILRTLLIATGILLVPIAIIFRAHAVKHRQTFDGKYVDQHYFTWRFMWLWDNYEEGIAWYGSGPLWWKIIYSSAIRNPANNLRYVSGISVVIDPDRVKFIGSLGSSDHKYLPIETIQKYDSDDENFWSLTWCGPYSNIRVQWEMLGRRWRFWIGWKIYPEDKFGIPDWDHRHKSAGFATQFRQIKLLS